MVRSRAVPGDILPCTGRCPSTLLLLLHSCFGAGHPGTATGIIWLPKALLGSCVLECVQVQFLSLGLSTLFCFCWLLTSAPAPGSSYSAGTGVTVAMGRTGLELPDRRGWCLPGVGGMVALPLGSSPVHGRGDTAVYSSTLPPCQHHPHSPQLPQGSKHSSPFLNVLFKAACSGWGGCLCCTDWMMGQEGVKCHWYRQCRAAAVAQAVLLPHRLPLAGQKCHGLWARAVVPAGAQCTAAAAGWGAAAPGADEEVDVTAGQE